jgi:hypothetical protein
MSLENFAASKNEPRKIEVPWKKVLLKFALCLNCTSLKKTVPLKVASLKLALS